MSKKLDTWMPLYIGDYLADTSRLTTEQHGAYLLLLMDYWRNGPPPDDEEVLAVITRLSAQQWRKHAPALRAFFRVEDGQWTQKRAESERYKAAGVNGKRAESGKAGAAKRWGKNDSESMANGMASAMANGMANPSLERWQNDASAETPSQLQPQSQPKTRTGGEFSSVVAPDPTDPRPPSEADDPPPTPSLAGRACMACRGANVHDVNPSHPDLLRLLNAGVTPEEVGATAAECAAKGKPRFAYVLATVERRRSEAAQAPQIAAARPVTVPCTDRQAEAFQAAMDERAATATRPPAALLAKLRGAVKVVTP